MIDEELNIQMLRTAFAKERAIEEAYALYAKKIEECMKEIKEALFRKENQNEPKEKI